MIDDLTYSRPFAKVFKGLWEGSMLGKADVQLVWVFLLAHANARGVVDVVPEMAAVLTGLPIDRVRAALAVLEAPDPMSRAPEEDGRRLVRLDDHRDWGWRIVNYGTYRAIRQADERREQDRVRKSASRAAARTTPDEQERPVLPLGGVNGGSCVHPSQVARPARNVDSTARREWMAEFAEYFWKHYPRKVGKQDALRAWMALSPKSQETLDRVMGGLARWCREHDEEINEPGMRHVPHPATWLRGGRYDDGAQ